MSAPSTTRTTIAVILLAALIRIGAAWHWSDNLDDDRDVYRAIALGIHEGRGFSSPGSTVPTAYRPPLYPLLLAATGGHSSTFDVAALNVLLGAATVAFVLCAARQLQLDARAALLAGLLTALDPLLVFYTSFPMTETFCTCLLTASLWALLRSQNATTSTQLRWAFAAGVLLGLTALCRPTVWACAALLIAAWGGECALRGWRSARPQASRVGRWAGECRCSAWSMGVMLLAAILTVAPWGLRNWSAFGRPIITTTHGGYTLLLGNNPAYYREVVQQPLGVVWDGAHGPGQSVWAAELHHEMLAAGLQGEIERDRWMSRRARQTIASEPQLFARACIRRLLHFWSLRPSVRIDVSAPGIIDRGVAVFYAIVFAVAACGFAAVVCGRVDRTRWAIPVLLIAGFMAVHLVYWTDARMRAPMMPEIALLAACGVECARATVARRRARSSERTSV